MQVRKLEFLMAEAKEKGLLLAVPDRVGNTSVTRVSHLAPHAADLVDCTVHLQGRIAEDGSSLSGG